MRPRSGIGTVSLPTARFGNVGAGAIISISTEVWERKLALYIAATGKNLREALNEEWPLLMRKIMDFTPPFKSKGTRGVSDLSVGRKAVAHDIYKTMRPFDPAQVRSKSLAKIVQSRNIEAFNIVASRARSGLMRGAEAIAFSPDVHLRARDRRGRVSGHDRNRVVLGSDAARLQKYVAGVQSRVGYAKSGWLKALLLVGGEAPAFVTKQGTSGGDVIDDRANETEPSITAINRTPWAVRKDEGERIKSDAYASRAQAIVAKVKTKMRLAREAAGFEAA